MVRLKRGAGWRHLADAAMSRDRELRQVALIRAYAWVEHALDAADAPPPKRPIAGRILRTFHDRTLSAGLTEPNVRAAIAIRHAATHQDAVPEPRACVEAVKTFQEVWHALSRHFVNLDSAVRLARQIWLRKGVLAVCLYGSLARGAPEPNDIDFLVLDNGEYSSEIEWMPYAEGTFSPVRATLEALALLDLKSDKLARCSACRWLDVSIIDGELFGRDREYTTSIREAQADPWFFVNISRDLKDFDAVEDTFVVTTKTPFTDLRASRVNLEMLGFA